MSIEFVLHASNLHKSYWQGDREVSVLAGANLEIQPNETLAITGVSGSGKSTLLHLLAGLDHPDSGTVSLAGQDVLALGEKEAARLRNRHLGFVYQFHHLLGEFTALENVSMPLLIGGMARQRAEEISSDMLSRVSLIDRVNHHPGALSGGERQRVAIARALVTQPQVVLADEPTGNLDEHSAEQIHDLITDIAGQTGTAFIVVTHNNRLAEKMQRQLRLSGGLLEPVR